MKYNRPLNTLRGLTLIELMVVIGIIGILASVIAVNAAQSGKISRDAKRQADLRILQSAVELYKNKNGRYPVGCNGADNWSGQSNSAYRCLGDSSQYITGLAPEFIPVLPYDDKINSENSESGYVYRTNVEGSVYKIMAMRTVESEMVDYNHEFKSCHIIPRPDGTRPSNPPTQVGINRAGWCNNAVLSIQEGSNIQSGTINHCVKLKDSPTSNNRFDISYGVWGGFAELVTGPNYAIEIQNTTKVICK